MMSIEIKNVSKSFGNIKALDDISLEFKENKIYGLFGRNGAGKSTLLNIISNRIFANSGEVLIDGENAVENDRAQGEIFLMSEAMLYPESMKIKDAFRLTKEFYDDFDVDYANRLSEQFGLKTNKKTKGLSTGYKSIFKIIVALATNVKYLIFDEPILGLDASHRDLFYKLLIENYDKNPRTIIISTHLIEEISTIVEDVVIIKDGKLIKQQSCEELLNMGLTVTGAEALVNEFAKDKNIIGSDTLGNYKSIYMLGNIDKNNIPSGLEVSKLDLQKLFIQLTNS
ncbi:MAG TPA: ABC transporter ATP-binding protein [Clostridiales bacterium]|nr:ABC transporter ATP-binding protein [Clostridiales bacterium]